MSFLTHWDEFLFNHRGSLKRVEEWQHRNTITLTRRGGIRSILASFRLGLGLVSSVTMFVFINLPMNLDVLYSELTLKTKSKLVLLVMDGLGDLATRQQKYLTPLDSARTPNLDALSKDSAQGRMIPVAPGITPGSGPGHLALFGYDPLEFQVGRGVIEALGLGIELRAGDVAARANFCTLDAKGIVTDRRAGRIETEVCEPLCDLLSKKYKKS